MSALVLGQMTGLETFGFREFRPGQEQVIESLNRAGRALAVFPTGGGKSLCYQLPALDYPGITLVVSPLIALMKDQIDFLQGRGIAAAKIDSSCTADEIAVINQGIETGELKLVYVAPERFNNERFLAQMKRTRISLFAIDEAHCISEWGHNFRPDYLKLADHARDMKVERILALTATATPQVVQDICKAFEIPEVDATVTGFYRANLEVLMTPCATDDRHQALFERLKERNPGSTIVYTTLQKTSEEVADWLSSHNFPARAYHAGLAAEVRTEVQEWWMSQPDGIVVATIAFGMGIDKADVRYVYHWNMPKSLESYSQEIGRAGRDGKPSVVEMFACESDLPVLENFIFGDTPEDESLQSLVDDIIRQPEQFDISMYDYSSRHNLRPLVLRTALTYLELEGAVKKGTPFYAEYEFRPTKTLKEVHSAFEGSHGEFVAEIIRDARKGVKWMKLDPEKTATRLGVERRRVARALEVLAERGLIELRASGVRDRYTRFAEIGHGHRLIQSLADKFRHREKSEIERLAMVVDLVQAKSCQVNALVGYFGEKRSKACGHCSYCLRKKASKMGNGKSLAPMEEVVPLKQVLDLGARHPDVLGSPRARAKFLCGLSSPSFSKAKITRDSLFGSLEEYRFDDVMAYCESQM